MPSTTTTPKLIIFTDLDGILIDRDTYSFEPALPARSFIKQKAVPLVLTSSKTMAEIEFYQKQLSLSYPMVTKPKGS